MKNIQWNRNITLPHAGDYSGTSGKGEAKLTLGARIGEAQTGGCVAMLPSYLRGHKVTASICFGADAKFVGEPHRIAGTADIGKTEFTANIQLNILSLFQLNMPKISAPLGVIENENIDWSPLNGRNDKIEL